MKDFLYLGSGQPLFYGWDMDPHRRLSNVLIFLHYPLDGNVFYCIVFLYLGTELRLTVRHLV